MLSGRETPYSGESEPRPQAAYMAVGGAELSIVVPTFNERDNVAELVRRLDQCMIGSSWEIIFVDDDSPDATASLVREIGQRDHRVRCLQRIGRRGLSSACIEGMLASSAPYLAVIDGDLQHDERLLAPMLDILKREEIDIVVGSRYAAGGGLGAWDPSRITMSRIAARLGRFIVRVDLTDPMSGFFMVRREAFAGAVRNLSAIGFKILLDLFASSPRPLRFKELPYQFRSRRAGESKLDNQIIWDYGMLLLDKFAGRMLPPRFIAFICIGSIGIVIHLGVVAVLFKGLNFTFIQSQIVASLVAMTSNFALNNILTYRDMRLRGWRWLRGWVVFVLICSVGVVANIGVAVHLFELNTRWALDALAGIVVGTVWNYSMSAAYSWQQRPQQNPGPVL